MVLGLVIAFALALCGEAGAYVRESHLRVDPHSYAGPRAGEPQNQVVAQTVQHWHYPGVNPWEVKLHLEMETMGRHDLSLDLDRAWIRSGHFTFGRIHPWDIAGDPTARRPWGILAQQSPQNVGILLGYGFDPESSQPSPAILGWFGAHYWSARDEKAPLAWGVSLTPFFLPGSGPNLNLSPTNETTAGRFGRRPPGLVEVNGQTLPIRYELDKGNVVRDILLNPQIAATGRWRASDRATTWVSLSRAPSPDPTFDAKEYLRVSQEGVDAVAVVRPKFKQRVLLTATQGYQLASGEWRPTLFLSGFAGSDRWWGAEAGVGTKYLSAYLGHELAWGDIEQREGTYPGRYSAWLLQADAQYPLDPFLLHAGIKGHLRQDDLWWRGGSRLRIAPHADLDLGFDLFAGSETSYFGEWRSNDRVYLVLHWEIGA